jgi:hypothetical protein
MTRQRFGSMVLGLWLLVAQVATAAKVETWRQDAATAFNKGKKERVVVSDTGRVRLGRPLGPVGSMTAARVWDLARDAKGHIYAATGDEGKVFRLVRDHWETVLDAADTQAISLASLPDGRVFVGTGPSGQVIEVTDSKKPATRPGPGVQYIWDLAADRNGNLYAATGPTGQLWKRDAKGVWSLLLDSKHSHLLCVAVKADGSVYAGSDGEGLIYRIAPDGRVSVVYDAPQSEIRALAIAPDGTLYAGTAADSGGGSGSGRQPSLFGAPPTPFSSSGPSSLDASTANRRAETPRPNEAKPDRPTPAGGSATPKPPSPGENAVYRVGADGVAREVFRSRVLVHALAWLGDRLLIGTGPEGQLFELRDQGRESIPIARLDSGQILAMTTESDGAVLLGTGDPGAVVRLSSGHVPAGTLTSDVLDAKLISRFGSVGWKADVPPGTSLAVQMRSGNVGDPDETWSPWSAEQTNPETARASIPVGRFAQYRAILRTDNPEKTPELRSLAIRYQTENLAPEITKIDIPDVTAADGSTRQAKVSIKWDASDPNGDDLEYTLQLKKEGWPAWIKLGDGPITESKWEWDTTAVPAGTYRVKLTAGDRPSNRPEDSLTRDRESEPFLIDHDAPSVAIARKEDGSIVISLKDDATRLTKAAYALDGGDWNPIFPDDSLFDAFRETMTLRLTALKPGSHLLMVRASDAAGNLGTADLIFEVRP